VEKEKFARWFVQLGGKKKGRAAPAAFLHVQAQQSTPREREEEERKETPK
jgi:hypothetical protein